ncbi:MAG: hypothetical protein ACRBCL_04620 [Maritimibacter sp.]
MDNVIDFTAYHVKSIRRPRKAKRYENNVIAFPIRRSAQAA